MNRGVLHVNFNVICVVAQFSPLLHPRCIFVIEKKLRRLIVYTLFFILINLYFLLRMFEIFFSTKIYLVVRCKVYIRGGFSRCENFLFIIIIDTPRMVLVFACVLKVNTSY